MELNRADSDRSSAFSADALNIFVETVNDGGTCRVMRAYHGPSHRNFTIKAVAAKPDSPDLRALRAEAKWLSQLDHPHIVRCFCKGLVRMRRVELTEERGAEDEELWLLLEDMRGGDLTRRVATIASDAASSSSGSHTTAATVQTSPGQGGGKNPFQITGGGRDGGGTTKTRRRRSVLTGRPLEEQVREIMRGILSALSYLHRLGLVHRDIKPENIALCHPSDFSSAKLLDFGVARRVGKEEGGGRGGLTSEARSARSLSARSRVQSGMDVEGERGTQQQGDGPQPVAADFSSSASVTSTPLFSLAVPAPVSPPIPVALPGPASRMQRGSRNTIGALPSMALVECAEEELEGADAEGPKSVPARETAAFDPSQCVSAPLEPSSSSSYSSSTAPGVLLPQRLQRVVPSPSAATQATGMKKVQSSASALSKGGLLQKRVQIRQPTSPSPMQIGGGTPPQTQAQEGQQGRTRVRHRPRAATIGSPSELAAAALVVNVSQKPPGEAVGEAASGPVHGGDTGDARMKVQPAVAAGHCQAQIEGGGKEGAPFGVLPFEAVGGAESLLGAVGLVEDEWGVMGRPRADTVSLPAAAVAAPPFSISTSLLRPGSVVCLDWEVGDEVQSPRDRGGETETSGDSSSRHRVVTYMVVAEELEEEGEFEGESCRRGGGLAEGEALSGTVGYFPPEVLRGKTGWTPAGDLFSLGVSLACLLTGVHPFLEFCPDGEGGRRLDETASLAKNARGLLRLYDPEWLGLSEEARSMVRKLCSRDPAGRGTAAEALHHPWFSAVLSRAPGGGGTSSKRAGPRQWGESSDEEEQTKTATLGGSRGEWGGSTSKPPEGAVANFGIGMWPNACGDFRYM